MSSSFGFFLLKRKNAISGMRASRNRIARMIPMIPPTGTARPVASAGETLSMVSILLVYSFP